MDFKVKQNVKYPGRDGKVSDLEIIHKVKDDVFILARIDAETRYQVMATRDNLLKHN